MRRLPKLKIFVVFYFTCLHKMHLEWFDGLIYWFVCVCVLESTSKVGTPTACCRLKVDLKGLRCGFKDRNGFGLWFALGLVWMVSLIVRGWARKSSQR